MHKSFARQDFTPGGGYRRILSILLWIALSTGLAVSIFTVVEELCLATACRDTASFTFFGLNMGWFGIAYFSFILILLWRRKSFYCLDWVLDAMIFSGIGAEFRLLWIQKYVIGSWCPLCVTICCSLFIAAVLLVIEKFQGAGSRGEKLPGWTVFVLIMIATGLAISIFGVKALT
ncbi:MAG: vitamin K epoxide reductase family protein [Deltaproteobacteria bacterium]